MSEKPYSYEDAVVTKGKNAGQIKDNDVAWEMAHAEKEVRDKGIQKGSLRSKINDMDIATKEIDKKAEAAAIDAAQRVIKEKAKADYEKMGFSSEASERVATEESSRHLEISEKIKVAEGRQLEELRSKIADSPGGEKPFSASDVVHIERPDTGRIKDAELAREMAEAEDKYRTKGFVYKLRNFFKRFILGKKSGFYEKGVNQGVAEADQIAETEIQKRAKTDYEKRGFSPTIVDQVANEQVENYRHIEEKKKEQEESEYQELKSKIHPEEGSEEKKERFHPAGGSYVDDDGNLYTPAEAGEIERRDG